MVAEKLNAEKLFSLIDETSVSFFNLVSSADEKTMNLVPFKDSWTIAQVATHVKKSNNAIAQGLQMNGALCEREPTERAEELKKTFLDFTVKFQSPDFIVPEKKEYKKEEVIKHLANSIEQLKQLRTKTDLSEIINLPAFGEITKLEILYFVLYHTQRHLHQLKNIFSILNNKN